ncbi:MAG: CvpA family protein [Clostridiales bacterium]|nr:CvpA family protein [Clostridiales bacterium]
MNIIDILVLVVLGFSLFAGMHKGFLASFLSTLGLIGSWFGAQKLFHILADAVLGNSTLMGVLSTYLEPAGFFDGLNVSGVTAQTTVQELVAKGADAVNGVASFIGQKVPFIEKALAANINKEAFAELNIHTLADYFDQTLWRGVFNVIAFVVTFFVLYFVATLLVNLINHVARLPMLRKVDWLVGGLFGLVRGVVISALLLAVLEPVLSAFSMELMTSLRDGSKAYGMLVGQGGLDFLTVKSWINDRLIPNVF